jgi:MoaA/NifB/PqqE/SkfB family radical SAM enzyme
MPIATHLAPSPSKSSAPTLLGRQLNIKVLDLCNATCSFCGYNKERLAERIRNGHIPYKLDVDDLKTKFPAIRAKGIRVLHLTGGEPTLHPRFRDLVRSAKQEGFQVRTGTNGSVLDEKLIDDLQESGVDFLWYSLDTFPFDKHLEHRGFTALKDKMLAGIELLRSRRINFFGQTVISKILPSSQGLPDLEGHLNYYRKELGINRFVFSYPMHRPDDEHASHLATLGSSAVSFSKEELLRIFARLLALKAGANGTAIVNPYVSLRQQIRDLEGKGDRMGCHAGRDIFFLGPDQETLRPCYHYSDRIVDRLDGSALRPAQNYLGCRSCRDQCFRDPSVLYAATSRPLDILREAWEDPSFVIAAAKDLGNLIVNRGYRNG